MPIGISTGDSGLSPTLSSTFERGRTDGHYNPRFVEPARAASQINCWEPVRGLTGASSIDETIIPARGSANPVIGISIATVASPGDSAAFVTAGRAKGIAGASLGAWKLVGGDASGMLRPLTGAAAASVDRVREREPALDRVGDVRARAREAAQAIEGLGPASATKVEQGKLSRARF